MNRTFILFTLSLFLGCFPARGETRITVDGQDAFDRLSGELSRALKAGEEDVVVEFRKGTYFYRENHLTLKGFNCPKQRVTLQCNGSAFVAEGLDYKLASTRLLTWSAPCKGPFDYKTGFVDLATLQSVDLRGPVRAALKRPEIVDKARGLCRIKVDEPNLPAPSAAGVFIILSQCYRGIVYPVERIESGYLYFRSEKVTTDSNAQTDPDADYKVLGELPHYILYNHPKGGLDLYMTATTLIGKRSRTIHQCDATNFLTLGNSLFGSFILQDARFVANSALSGGSLLLIDGVSSTETAVKGCSFDGIRSDIIRVNRSTNFLFCDNTVTRSYRRGISLDFFTQGAEIRNNRFSDTGYMMDHDFCIEGQAGGMWIHHNVFENFSYGAIGVGSYYMQPIPASSSGVIEENELYCTPDFLARPARLLMDSGAIYTWTINKDITIRNNDIHDIGGYGWNRGIFCDDGTVHVKIVGNRIRNIRNSYCIDLRLCTEVEKHPLSRIARVNVGNEMRDNVVDGKVRFQNRDKQ